MNKQSAPLISVIVAVLNGSKTLQQCIESIANQTYRKIEIIVIDGGSKDGSVAILELNREKIAYWISEKDTGVYNAWNKGLRKSRGEWIIFLGADDYFLNDLVMEQIAIRLETIPNEFRLVYSRVMLIGVDGEAIFSVGEPWDIGRDRFKKGVCLPHQGVVHRRSLFDQNGKFDESFRIGGDYELMLRELKTADAVFIPDIIATGMRQGGLSSNPASSINAMLDIRRAQKMHTQYIPSLLWLKAMVRIYFRLLLWNSIGEGATRKLFDLGRRFMGLPAYWTRT
jgi:glycosyltransferase involved in cell wall biosynthesis